jgi:hypothetical protein
MEEAVYVKMKEELSAALNDSNVAEVIGTMQQYFGHEKFSLWNLFKDEQRKVLDQIIRKDVVQAEEDFRSIYRRNYNIMSVMNDARLPIPQVLLNNLSNVINADLRHLFENGSLHLDRLNQLAADAVHWNVDLDKTSISFAASEKLYRLLRVLELSETGIREMQVMLVVFDVMAKLDIELDLVEFQNEYFHRGKLLLEEQHLLKFREQSNKMEWIRTYLEIGNRIGVKLPERLSQLV